MFLAVDQGNSFIKATFIDPLTGNVKTVVRLSSSKIDELLLLMEKECVENVAFSGVGHLDVRLVETLRNAVGGQLMVLTHNTPLPIRIDYRSEDTLGLDRISAAVGAYVMKRGRNILIIDAGTAVTADYLDAYGTFRGGNISPGVSLRFDSLHSATAALPKVCAEGAQPLLGYDTQTAIRSGVINGISFELEGLYKVLAEQYPGIEAIITGGDSQLFYDKLKKKINISLQPNLVALGLLSIYKYNEKNE